MPSDLDPLLERIGDARYVLLGEASHGTSEYLHVARGALEATDPREGLLVHRGRRRLARLLSRQSLREGAIRTRVTSAREVLHAFERWPTWMWANREIVELVEWLRRYNDQRRVADDGKVGFYGLDVYSLWDSMRAVVDYLERMDPQLAAGARRAYRASSRTARTCRNTRARRRLVPTSCEDEAVAVLRALRSARPSTREDGREGVLQRRAERVRRQERRALLPDDGARRPAVVERARPSHGRDARPLDARISGSARRRRSSGSTTRTSATRASPTWRARGW